MNTPPLTAEQVRVKAIRESVDLLLAQCTEKQVAFFHRIHDQSPYKGWANCPDDLIDVAHDLCVRTVNHNRREAGAKP